MEIGDLDAEESNQFLIQRGIDETTAKGIFNIAGGRLTLLNEAQLRAQEGQTLNG